MPSLDRSPASRDRLTAAQSYYEMVRADGPVAYWRLGELSGTSAKDERGTFTGTYTGGPTLAVAGALPGDSNTGVTFDGATQYMTTGLVATSLLTGWTLELWAKTANLTQNGIMARCGISTAGFALLQCNNSYANSGQGIRGVAGASNGLSVFSSNYFFADTATWYYLVLMSPATDTLRFYINGAREGSNSVTLNAPTTTVTLGMEYAADGVTPQKFWNGTLDEVAIYERVLSAEQVGRHYRIGKKLATR